MIQLTKELLPKTKEEMHVAALATSDMYGTIENALNLLDVALSHFEIEPTTQTDKTLFIARFKEIATALHTTHTHLCDCIDYLGLLHGIEKDTAIYDETTECRAFLKKLSHE